jgi:hypothetical protein
MKSGARQGTPERAAYDAANAQYAKDDGNPAIHLQGLSMLSGYTGQDELSYDVDLYSGEDGDYDYHVTVRKEGSKWLAEKAIRQ